MDSLEYIDAYFSGESSPEEASQFEQRIQEDPAFAGEVADYLGAKAAFKEAAVDERKARFRELYRRDVIGRPEVWRLAPRRWIPLAAAAAVFGVIALAWLLYLRPADASKVADRYIRQNLTVLPAKMGGADGIQTGINLYNSGDLPGALHQFENELRLDSLNPAALFYAGIVSLRMDNYDKALTLFTTLATHTDPHVNPALFYEALTLMRRDRAGDPDHAKQLLKRIVEEDLNKKMDARELLSKL